MATKKAAQAETFTVTNSGNNFDPINGTVFATEQEAIDAAIGVLQGYPGATVYVNKRLRTFKAKVEVEEVANETPAEPDDSAAEGTTEQA